MYGLTRTKSHGRTYRADRRPIVRVSILRLAFPVRVSPPRASVVANGGETWGKSKSACCQGSKVRLLLCLHYTTVYSGCQGYLRLKSTVVFCAYCTYGHSVRRPLDPLLTPCGRPVCLLCLYYIQSRTYCKCLFCRVFSEYGVLCAIISVYRSFSPFSFIFGG